MSHLEHEKFIESKREAWEEEDIKLHEEAGLVLDGRTDDGDYEWIGTDAQWKKFNLLTKE